MDKLHSTIRNCEGKYPNSSWAKTGYTINHIRIGQCPKTYITPYHKELIDLYDLSKQYSYGINLSEVPARFIDLARIIERERASIRSQEEVERVARGKV